MGYPGFDEIEEAGKITQPDRAAGQSRQITTVLLVSGMLLVVLGQLVYQQMLLQLRWLLLLLVGIGLLSFVAAIVLARDSRRGRGIDRERIFTSAFGISFSQLLLLLFAPCFALMTALAAGDRLEALHPIVSIVAWLLAVGYVVAGSIDLNQRFRLGLPLKETAIVIGLFAAAFMLRAVALDAVPPTLSGDEGSSGLVAVRYLNGEIDNLFTVGWFSFPSLYFAFQSLGIWILGQTTEGLRITSSIAGALTVVALYWLARTLFGRLTAMFASIILAAFHFHIHFSRIGLNNIWDGFFAVFTMAALAHGWQSGRRLSFVLAGLALGLGQYFYVSMRAFPLLLLLWVVFVFIFNRQALLERLPDILLMLAVAFVVALPLTVYFAQHPAEFNAPMQRVTVFNGWLEQESILQNKSEVRIILEQVRDSALGFAYLPLKHWYNPGVPLLLPAAAGLFVLGLLWSLIHMNWRYFLIILPILLVIVIGAVSLDAPASQRYIVAAPLASLLIAVALSEVSGLLIGYWPRFRYQIMIAAFLVVIWLAAVDLRYYFTDVFRSYVLGGINTQVATEIAHFLDERDPVTRVYFFGIPRMGYRSLSTIPYLVPDVTAVDVDPVLEAPPGWAIEPPAVFIFLPERRTELDYVRSAYPGGSAREIVRDDGLVLFVVYELTR